MGFELSHIVLNDLFTVTLSEQELLEIKTTIEKETIDKEVRKIAKIDLNDSEILKKLDGAEPMQHQANSYESWTNYWAPSTANETESVSSYYNKESMSPKECTVKYEFYDQLEEAKQEITNAKYAKVSGIMTDVQIGGTTVFSTTQKFQENFAKEEQRKMWRMMNFHWTSLFYNLA